MIYLLILLLLIVLAWAVAATFYLWRFARIILILENDFSEATEVLQNAEDALEACLEIPMFFDSPEIQRAALEGMDTIRVAKLGFAGMIRKFTQRSRQKYVEVVDDAKDDS